MENSLATGPIASHLTLATHRALDTALGVNGAGGNDHLHRALRELCDQAHQAGARPETLIVLFKRSWAERADVRALPVDDATQVFKRVITMCLDQYYGNR
jgi:hypothetical protein